MNINEWIIYLAKAGYYFKYEVSLAGTEQLRIIDREGSYIRLSDFKGDQLYVRENGLCYESNTESVIETIKRVIKK